MATDNLKQSLKNLHASLAATANVDPELTTLLQVLERDIQSLLERQPSQAAESALTSQPGQPADSQLDLQPAPQPAIVPDAESLVERAQEISAKFAVRHPHMEPALRELADTLARIGI